MARDPKKGENSTNSPNNISTKIRRLMGDVQSNMDSLYTNTYFNTTGNRKELDYIAKSINTSIDNIISNNVNNSGMPNISALYSRLQSKLQTVQKDKGTIKGIEDVFNDNAIMDSVMGSYVDNKYLRDLDVEIDTVCKYMPKLLEALEVRKDNVLSADHFSKDFINVVNDHTDPNNQVLFSDRIADIKEKYDLLELIEEIYDKTAKYGEVFLYNVPYKKALERLLANKSGTSLATLQTESCQIVCENSAPFNMEPNDILNDTDYKLNIQLNTSNIIESAVRAYQKAESKMKSVSEAAVNNSIGDSGKFTHTIGDELEFDKLKDDDNSVAADGLIEKDKKKDKLGNIPGCILKILDRSCVIPVYIENMCLGYYYFEFAEYNDGFNYSGSSTDPLASLKSNTKVSAEADNIKNNQMLKYISGQISQFIDSKFINNNQDLAKEIYIMLKHNDVFNISSQDSFKVTFIPPEDMVHVYFKKDDKTHRGISDLERALFPAKLYASLYIGNTIANLTRGQDKRVYYVRQTVDTNISKLLLNTIDQIKKSNFGIRQVENINHVLNILGRFNDYVIPRGPDGSSPIDFEIMPGQDVDPQTDLMNALEEMAINSTDVPLELIQARQSIDYAVQLTMTNSKFLRKVYNRQARYQKFCSRIITTIYNSEYNENTRLTVTLPPPMFLNISNTNQVIDNTRQYVDSLVEMDTADEQNNDVVKAIYRRKLLQYHLGSYINISKHEELYKQAKQEAKVKEDSMQNDSSSSY